MSARLPTVVYLPPVSDETFLKTAVDLLERLQAESELRGHAFLASLLAITRGEAEDGLGTHRQLVALQTKESEEDDGAAEMAQRLSYRAERIA
jgi:hypothetical protein